MGPHGNRMNTTGETTVSAQDDSDEQQEVIEVQILPQVNIILKVFMLWSFRELYPISIFDCSTYLIDIIRNLNLKFKF